MDLHLFLITFGNGTLAIVFYVLGMWTVWFHIKRPDLQRQELGYALMLFYVLFLGGCATGRFLRVIDEWGVWDLASTIYPWIDAVAAVPAWVVLVVLIRLFPIVMAPPSMEQLIEERNAMEKAHREIAEERAARAEALARTNSEKIDALLTELRSRDANS